MDSVYTLEQLRARLSPVFRRNNVRRATVFGSYAKHAATRNSDVDLLVDSDLRGLSFFGLLEDVCQTLSCPVDLIDAREVAPDSPIDREIHATGVVIYER